MDRLELRERLIALLAQPGVPAADVVRDADLLEGYVLNGSVSEKEA